MQLAVDFPLEISCPQRAHTELERVSISDLSASHCLAAPGLKAVAI